jgi:hypothetical protein
LDAVMSLLRLLFLNGQHGLVVALLHPDVAVIIARRRTSAATVCVIAFDSFGLIPNLISHHGATSNAHRGAGAGSTRCTRRGHLLTGPATRLQHAAASEERPHHDVDDRSRPIEPAVADGGAKLGF